MATYPLILTNKLDQDMAGSFSERRKELKFGDGNRQTMADGLNTNEAEWNLSWSSLTVAEATQLHGFFKARKGTQRIEWTPPLNSVPQIFTCVKHSGKLQNGSGIVWTYNATLVREFSP